MSRYKLWWDNQGSGQGGSVEPVNVRIISRESIKKAVEEFADFIADQKEGQFAHAYADEYGFETIWVYDMDTMMKKKFPQKFHVTRSLQVTYIVEEGVTHEDASTER